MANSQPREVPPIKDAERVVERFGGWPSFHDAEVVRLVLDRAAPTGLGPSLTVAVYVYDTDGTVAPSGRYTLCHETLVTFAFHGVVQLTLDDFSDQNAIWALNIEDISGDQLEGLGLRVEFLASHGVGMAFVCREASVVDMQPWSWGRNFDSSARAV